jgi:hypothetical protein
MCYRHALHPSVHSAAYTSTQRVHSAGTRQCNHPCHVLTLAATVKRSQAPPGHAARANLRKAVFLKTALHDTKVYARTAHRVVYVLCYAVNISCAHARSKRGPILPHTLPEVHFSAQWRRHQPTKVEPLWTTPGAACTSACGSDNCVASVNESVSISMAL